MLTTKYYPRPVPTLIISIFNDCGIIEGLLTHLLTYVSETRCELEHVH